MIIKSKIASTPQRLRAQETEKKKASKFSQLLSTKHQPGTPPSSAAPSSNLLPRKLATTPPHLKESQSATHLAAASTASKKKMRKAVWRIASRRRRRQAHASAVRPASARQEREELVDARRWLRIHSSTLPRSALPTSLRYASLRPSILHPTAIAPPNSCSRIREAEPCVQYRLAWPPLRACAFPRLVSCFLAVRFIAFLTLARPIAPSAPLPSPGEEGH